MKRYVALFVSLLLVFSTGPAFANFWDALKGLIPGHHAEPIKPKAVHHSHRARPSGNKEEQQPEESPSPNPETSPGQEQSPGPSPTAVQSPESDTDGGQSAGVDQSPKAVSSPIVMQNSGAASQGASVDIDPPPLY